MVNLQLFTDLAEAAFTDLRGRFRFRKVMRTKGILISGAVITIAVVGCRRFESGDPAADSVKSQPEVTESTDLPDEDEYVAENDIAMTVRSVADAINTGDRIDSADYAFKGVLTDGSGMPLFTDVEGLPGEWEIDVLSPSMVRIRNMNTGDLLPEELVEYLAGALQLSEGESLELVDDRKTDEKRVSVFDFGKGRLTVESKLAADYTGEPGQLMEITMEASAQAREAADSVAQKTPAQQHSRSNSGAVSASGRYNKAFRHRR